MRSSLAVFIFGRIGHLRLLRLAGVVGRRRRRECLRWVCEVIANPSMCLSRAAVAGAAGDKPVKALELLSDELGTVPTPLGQRFGFKCANHLTNNC